MTSETGKIDVFIRAEFIAHWPLTIQFNRVVTSLQCYSQKRACNTKMALIFLLEIPL